MTTPFVEALEAEMSTLRELLSQDLRYVRLREIERLRELYREPNEATQGPGSSLVQLVIEGAALWERAKGGSRPPLRKASPDKAKAIDAARMMVENRSGPVPTADIYSHLQALEIPVPGTNPVNNLSAMLSNSGLFRANGRMGWTIRKDGDVDEDGDEPNPDDQRDAAIIREADDESAAVEAARPIRGPGPPPLIDDDDDNEPDFPAVSPAPDQVRYR